MSETILRNMLEATALKHSSVATSNGAHFQQALRLSIVLSSSLVNQVALLTITSFPITSVRHQLLINLPQYLWIPPLIVMIYWNPADSKKVSRKSPSL